MPPPPQQPPHQSERLSTGECCDAIAVLGFGSFQEGTQPQAVSPPAPAAPAAKPTPAPALNVASAPLGPSKEAQPEGSLSMRQRIASQFRPASPKRQPTPPKKRNSVNRNKSPGGMFGGLSRRMSPGKSRNA